MTRASWRVSVFALVCLAQLGVAASIVWRSERLLAEGQPFRFRTAPVDPADLVRGRYVALRFVATRGPPLDERPFEKGERVYALLAEDDEGFATVAGLRHAQPEGVAAYLTVTVEEATSELVHFRFPVDRFYLPEEEAPAAERAHRAAAGKGTWAQVRVRHGQAMIEDLVIATEQRPGPPRTTP